MLWTSVELRGSAESSDDFLWVCDFEQPLSHYTKSLNPLLFLKYWLSHTLAPHLIFSLLSSWNDHIIIIINRRAREHACVYKFIGVCICTRQSWGSLLCCPLSFLHQWNVLLLWNNSQGFISSGQLSRALEAHKPRHNSKPFLPNPQATRKIQDPRWNTQDLHKAVDQLGCEGCRPVISGRVAGWNLKQVLKSRKVNEKCPTSDLLFLQVLFGATEHIVTQYA